MVLKSYSKINLTLSIKKKLKNGLHSIQSIYCLINLFDKILIKKNNKKIDKIFFYGPYSKYVKKSDNSIIKVLKIMRKYNLISEHYSIKVYKRIPVFSGLGGGTSNAVTVFKSLVNRKINNNLLNKIIDYVGTDFRIFLNNQGFLKNLKTVKKFDKKYTLYFLVVYPKIRCSTKQIYSMVKKLAKKNITYPKKFSSKQAFLNSIKNINNDLQFIVENKYKIISKLIKNISKEKGCYFSKMTGSGSASYGLFKDEKSAKVALNSLRKRYPKFWFSIAKTI